MSGLAAETHNQASKKRLVPEAAFAVFQGLMVELSVQRPPYSSALFNLADVRVAGEYMLNTYFSHFKLYQYAFLPVATMEVSTRTPLVLPPTISPPLARAITWEVHEAQLAAAAAEAEAAAAVAKAEVATKAEAERQAKIDAAYEASIPTEVTGAVGSAIAEQLAAMQEEMEAKFAATEEELLSKIGALESQVCV